MKPNPIFPIEATNFLFVFLLIIAIITSDNTLNSTLFLLFYSIFNDYCT